MEEATTRQRDEFADHLRQTLGIEMPEMWESLWERAPWAMEAYSKLREGIFGSYVDDASDARLRIPKRYLELIVIAIDIAVDNEWGTRVHTRAAIDAGASASELVDTVIIAIMACGMTSYRKTGYIVLDELSKQRIPVHVSEPEGEGEGNG